MTPLPAHFGHFSACGVGFGAAPGAGLAGAGAFERAFFTPVPLHCGHFFPGLFNIPIEHSLKGGEHIRNATVRERRREIHHGVHGGPRRGKRGLRRNPRHAVPLDSMPSALQALSVVWSVTP